MSETLTSARPAAVAGMELAGQFAAQGFAGPVRILSALECRSFLKTVRQQKHRPPLDWSKGYAASSPIFFELGTHPALVGILTTLLGQDFLLWGARLLTRRPGEVHPWHTDIETAEAAGGTVTVWIGLENTHRDSSLLVIPYSHRFGVSVQEVRHRRGKGRGETTSDEIVQWARQQDERCHLATPDVSDGEALFFDGRLWHGSKNVFHKTRQALLLQYATPDVAIRMPDPKNCNWPFRKLESPKPPCVMVRGSDSSGVNRIVAQPLADRAEKKVELSPRVFPLQLPLAPDDEKGWKPYPLFNGATAGIQNFSCHVSVLSHGCCPHPPHRHDDEEILMMLEGEADLLLLDLPSKDGTQRKRLRAGEFVFYPAHFAHTLEAKSRQPANYLMFKWKNGVAPTETETVRSSTFGRAGEGNPANRLKAELQTGNHLAFGHFKLLDQPDHSPDQRALPRRIVLEGPTGCLRKLHCHLSTLAPGTGYDPHSDAYDVAIIVLQGEVETLGQTAKPHSVIFYPAGQPHGLRNIGITPASYVVFEFHGDPRVAGVSSFLLPRWIPAKFAEPAYWRQRLKRIATSIRKRLP